MPLGSKALKCIKLRPQIRAMNYEVNYSGVIADLLSTMPFFQGEFRPLECIVIYLGHVCGFGRKIGKKIGKNTGHGGYAICI